MKNYGHRVLLIGYGNPGRLDDGLGPALVERLQAKALPGLDLDADYQLSPEDALAVAGHDVAIFADAAVAGPEPFCFARIGSDGASSGLGSHSVEPAEVAALARELFGAATATYALGIRGYAFDAFGEGLSKQAACNLARASEFIEEVIRNRSYEQAASCPVM